MKETAENRNQLVIAFGNDHNEKVEPAFTLTERGIVIRENLTYEGWKEGLRAFKWMHSSLKLGFAKYLEFGKLNFDDEMVNTALTQLEFDMPTVNAAFHINNVPESIKQNGLSAEHYIVLGRSGLKPNDQIKWATTASKENLTPSQLKMSIKEGKVVDVAIVRQHTHGVITIDGIYQEYLVWYVQVGELEGILKLDAQNIREVAALLEPIAHLYGKIMDTMSD